MLPATSTTDRHELQLHLGANDPCRGSSGGQNPDVRQDDQPPGSGGSNPGGEIGRERERHLQADPQPRMQQGRAKNQGQSRKKDSGKDRLV